VHGAHKGVVAAENRQGLVQPFLIEAAGLVQAAAEPEDSLFVEDDRGIAAAALEYHQAHRVRAEVDDRGTGGFRKGGGVHARWHVRAGTPTRKKRAGVMTA
jgi:hypothetical protein